MFGWLKSLFGSETANEHVVLPPLPSKVKKAEKLVDKKIAKKVSTKKEAPKKEAPKVKATKPKAASKKKEAVKPLVDPVQLVDSSPKKKKAGRAKKTVVSETVQKEQN